jgi:hypothetical protein
MSAGSLVLDPRSSRIGQPALAELRFHPTELAALLLALARRVQRSCLVLLVLAIALMAASLAVLVETGIERLVFGGKLVAYLALFAAFGVMMLNVHFQLDSLPRRDVFLAARRGRAMRLPPDPRRAPRAYRPILFAAIGEEGGSFAAGVRPARRAFTTVFTLLAPVLFLADAWFASDRAMALTGLAVWTYLSFYVTHEALRYFDDAVDEYLQTLQPESSKRTE